MRELDEDGKPLTASKFNWQGKGYDGFIGYGYDKEKGECCEDCICDDECEDEDLPPVFYIRYEWQAPCTDLDTQTEFLGESVGFGCGNNPDFLFWQSGDNVGAGGFELVKVLFDLQDKEPDEVFELNIYAGWYDPAWNELCDGSFQIYIMPNDLPPSLDNPPLLEKEIVSFVRARGCQQNFITTFQFSKNEIKWK